MKQLFLYHDQKYLFNYKYFFDHDQKKMLIKNIFDHDTEKNVDQKYF